MNSLFITFNLFIIWGHLTNISTVVVFLSKNIIHVRAKLSTLYSNEGRSEGEVEPEFNRNH